MDEGSERLEGPLVCVARGGAAATWASLIKKKGGTSASCVFECVCEGEIHERREDGDCLVCVSEGEGVECDGLASPRRLLSALSNQGARSHPLS